MKAVIQRVTDATLKVDGQLISQIGHGLVVYFCVEKGDDQSLCKVFANKLAKLRIFSDANGKMNLSVADVGGEILMVSQFTLAGDLSGGNRPSFFGAEEPTRANQMYQDAVEILRQLGLVVKTGVFGADMKIAQTNDGPVTINWQA